MKLLHLGDLHLGRTLADFDLKDDQKFILDQILGIVRDKKIDAVLIAGDVYDKSVPSEAATVLLDGFLSSLSGMGISVFLISGNHDSDDRLNFASRLLVSNGIFISSVYDGTLHHETVQDEYGAVDIWMLPFVKASQVRHFYPEEQIDNYDDAVRTVLAHAEIDVSRRNIILAHQFVTSVSGDPVFGGSESLGTQSVGTVERIGCSCFDRFDYAALGHIHSPQPVGRKQVRYSGSPLKYSLSEADNCKSVPVVTLREKGESDIELIPLHPMRDLRHLRGTMKQLLKEENITAPEDFIYATLTDEEPVSEVMAIFRQHYPNTVKIEFDNSHTRQAGDVDISVIAENRSFSELISDFYRQMYGCEISEEEMAIMESAAKEAGVINETD